ncbi:MAG: hypothetical protein SCALA702_29630 [Melioribacteraceae bacterium]|nr:MAG: hypothetical protein SCALA702_29630 [Melioribacteraceae bacterium]
MPARTKKTNKSNSGDNPYIIPIDKKKKIFGFVLSVFALLLFLSILSFSRFDEANLTYRFTDLFRVFSDDPEFIKRAESTHNWLGIFGAYISSFFVNRTIGYFSLVFPSLLFIWGYTVITATEKRTPVFLSNMLIISALLLASFFGLLRFELGILPEFYELSGNIGSFFGKAIGRLLGGLGGIIFFSAAMFTVALIAFDINFEKIFAWFREQLSDYGNDGEEEEIPAKDTHEEKPSRIKKIKKLKKDEAAELMAEITTESEQEDSIPEPAGEELDTPIKIIKRDEPEEVISAPALEEEPESKDEKKAKKDSDEDDDEILPLIDKEEEAKLPEQWEEEIKYTPPGIDLLEVRPNENYEVSEEELKRNAELLKQKLSLFDIKIEDITVTPGPVVTLYEIVPAPGVKISRIVSLENDIALALAARGIRIIAPIPGKSAIGVEIPNAESSMVSARTVISKLKEKKAILPLALGKTISGDVYIADLAQMPHLLIAGSTGSGKSVGINMIINSLLYSLHPSDIKFAIIDPKKIELSFYKKLNMHFLAVSPDIDEEIVTNPQNALVLLRAVILEMEMRYTKLAKAGVRNIVDYNKKVCNPRAKPKDSEDIKHFKLPYIVVVIDELADLMMTSGKEVEEPIARLAQLARAVGIHLIVATQRPSVNVITGVIKANFSARIAYQVATKIDSRTILDMNGAERLLGKGDMLFLPGGAPKPVRVQNAFISTEEVEKITNFVYVQEGFSKRYLLPSVLEKTQGSEASFIADLDNMFSDAAKVIVRHQQGSVSLLQRRLKLGYSRAARIVDQLEQAGIVGPSEGSKAREVLVETEEELETILRSL